MSCTEISFSSLERRRHLEVFDALQHSAAYVRRAQGGAVPLLRNGPRAFQLTRVIIYESVQLVLFVIADTRRSGTYP